MGTYGSYILGIGIQDIGTKNKIHFGVQVDLNVWFVFGVFLIYTLLISTKLSKT